MIRSMTGFGSASVEREGGWLAVELRSVNSRHLKLSLRLPEGAEVWEPELRSLVPGKVARGHLEMRVEAGGEARPGPTWELDEVRVEAILKGLETLREKYALPGQVDLSLLLRFGEVLREAQRAPLGWLGPKDVREVTERALDALVEMREREGARLEEDLRARLGAIRKGVEEVARLAPGRLQRERARLRSAVAELAQGVALDEERLAREVAILADKWDIGEELVRTRAHLDGFEEYLDAPADEPVGKRLAFLVQELHREINTMGAKANDSEITRHVIEMKNEVERLREQVENVE